MRCPVVVDYGAFRGLLYGVLIGYWTIKTGGRRGLLYGVLGVIIWRFGGYCMAVYSVTIEISTRCGGKNFLLLFVSVVNTYKYALTANANAICSCVSFPLRVYLSRVEDVPVTEQVGHGSRRPTLRTDGHQQARRWAYRCVGVAQVLRTPTEAAHPFPCLPKMPTPYTCVREDVPDVWQIFAIA